MFLTLIATAITLLITTFFLIETQADIQKQRGVTEVPKITQKANVSDEILVDNADFSITRLKSTGHFIVVIKHDPYKEIKLQAEEWFDVNYPDSDICELSISFVPAKEVTGNLNAQDAVVEGCTAPRRPTPDELKAR